jgi:hypothetical protein
LTAAEHAAALWDDSVAEKHLVMAVHHRIAIAKWRERERERERER